MWSVTRKPVSIYVSRRIALVQSRRSPAIQFDLSADCSLERVLATIESSVATASSLSVFLSASFCPAVEVSYPRGLRNYAERKLLVRAKCAAYLNTDPEAIHVEFDPLEPGIAAPLLLNDWHNLLQWSKAKGCRLRHVQPMWAYASRFSSRIRRALAIEETDSITLIGSANGAAHLRALSFEARADVHESSLRRMHQALEMQSSETQIFRFGVMTSTRFAGCPDQWSDRWSSL